MALFRKSSFCVVTGASRGLGREIALQLSKEWSQAGIQSDMVITARNEKALEVTKTLINSQAPGINVHIVCGDLSDMDTLPAFCAKIVDLIDTTKHQQGVLVHNAATMNEFVPFLSQNDPKKIQAYLDTNVTSMIVLTTRFLSAFPSGQPHYVIHISSVLATIYYKWYSLYSTVKAARTAFMGSLREEIPEIRQLNYSPGPCDTDMLKETPPDTFSIDAPIRVLTSEESIQKLVQVLKDDKFANGCTIDYFDRI